MKLPSSGGRPVEQTAATPAPSNRRMFAIAGLVVAVMLLVSGTRVLFRWASIGDSAPELTRLAIDQAQERWRNHGPKSYDLDLSFESTDAASEIHLEVRQGEPTLMQRNGVEISSPSEGRMWTVEGQFERIRQDFEREKERGTPAAGEKVILLTPRGTFDPERGHPVFYSLRGSGTPVQYHWRVEQFTPREG